MELKYFKFLILVGVYDLVLRPNRKQWLQYNHPELYSAIGEKV